MPARRQCLDSQKHKRISAQEYERYILDQGQLYGYGTEIPVHEAGVLARVLLPKMQAFFESGEGQREFAEWKAQQNQDKVKRD